jgi:hypothetical protein
MHTPHPSTHFHAESTNVVVFQSEGAAALASRYLQVEPEWRYKGAVISKSGARCAVPTYLHTIL